jgi:thiol-disulfide isomerase/thioredoxin
MNSTILTCGILFACALSAAADEKFGTLTVGKTTYTNVTVTAVTATDIYFTSSGGMGNAKIENLSPGLKEHFHYNEAKARAIEQKQAQANNQYRAQAARAGTTHPADESIEADSNPTTPASSSWLTDLPGALDQARSGNKLVLLDFTGSDWCPWCIKLDHDILSTSEFAAYAQSKLVLVKVDFPRNTPQSDDLKQANEELGRRFHVNGYPTCILVDASGNELGRQTGYLAGGPAAFQAELDGFVKK